MASSSHPSQPAEEARPSATAVAAGRRVNRLSAHVCPSAASPVVAAAAATAVAAAPLHPLFQGRPNLMLVPIATPLLPLDEAAKPAPATARRRLDVPSLERYVQHLYGEGYEGIYVGGSSGEGYHMEEALRMELCERAVEASRGSGKIVMVHVGAAKSAEAIRLAAHAAAAARSETRLGAAPRSFSLSIGYRKLVRAACVILRTFHAARARRAGRLGRRGRRR